MINRSLIRIKTVQILYSYLLTRSDFKLAPAPNPADASRDRQFAYSVYLDLMTLLLKLSSIPMGGVLMPSDAGLKKNRVGSAIIADPVVRKALNSDPERMRSFDSCLEDIHASLVATPVYKAYKGKRKLQMSDDVAFWTAIVADLFRKNKSVERVLRRNEMFSHLGYEMGVNMLLDTLSGLDDTRSSYEKARQDLADSLRCSYNLYHALLMLPVVLTDVQKERFERNRNKYIPTEEDLNPNTRLQDNLLVKALRECPELKEYLDNNPDASPAEWRDIDVAASRMLDLVLNSQYYADYKETASGDFAVDAAFWREVLRNVIFPSDELAELMETKSVYWNDDLAIMSTFTIKTIRRSYAAPDDDDDLPETFGKITLLPMFMNSEDERFGLELFEDVVEKREKYRSFVDMFINKDLWDSERLAFMDIVVMLTAIAEIINYPRIPVPVTMNEYIEIANDYSTPKSGQFINGILSSIVKYLNGEGVINK